jgi:hypothetical protein
MHFVPYKYDDDSNNNNNNNSKGKGHPRTGHEGPVTE